jgi:DNA-binding protein H-NS
MAGLNIKSLDVDGLLALRSEIDKRLTEKRRLLEKQLSLLVSENGSSVATVRALASYDRRKFSALKGRRIEPKYRGPGGETWAGRGAQPRWLAVALKSGKKLEDFLIEKPARKQPRKPRAKRQQARQQA